MIRAVACERIVLEVTGRCRNACLHCYNPWRGSGTAPAVPELSREELVGIVRNVRRDAPLAQVAVSGGEPLLRADLPELVCDLADEGLESVVITSGVPLDADRLRRFPEGTVFEVTLLGGDRESHDRLVGRVAFDRVLQALLEIRRQRCRFVVVVVVTAQNAHDVARTIRLGLAMGAEGVLLNRVNLTRRTLPIAPLLAPGPDALRAALRDADDAAARHGIGISISVPVPPCVVDPGEFPHLHFGWCPRGGKDAYYTVGSDGALRPCNHSSRTLGHAGTERFRDLVLGKRAKAFWRPVPAECRACEHPLASQCRGGCPAATDECHGTRERIDPFVPAALARASAPAR